ncbi:cytochrome C oxidase subunit IV family protein [Paracoccus sp. YLB-12]|uniref:Cytochrome bo(3) ubiquinol oxidase subunit 4 n=1 Tax=Paracoccus maritimus TaxID=2933292 RepID=A0ABT2KDZ8_9RHOB|nr:cytochrome C oxidase subunit IV family protein [Paracoccus sp. YLB-12]MCT4334748.1 cytochrome C oxidase subunit IV family protein [Paracoccus sp. YLB-12]
MSEERRERRSYLIGTLLSILLTAIAFATIPLDLPRGGTMLLIGISAVLQVIVQLRFFLHIDLSRQKREDLQLILFSLLLLGIMAGGTIWILTNLSQRMM